MAVTTYYLVNFISTGKILLVYRWEAGPFGIAMLAGFITFWLVSLVTKPEDKEKTEEFFDNMRRKSDAVKLGPDGKKPLAEETGEELVLIDLPGWKYKSRRTNFFRRYREDAVGFLLAWLVVGLLILLAWGILQI